MLFGMEIRCVNLSLIIIEKNESNQHKRQQSAFPQHQDFTSVRFKKFVFIKMSRIAKMQLMNRLKISILYAHDSMNHMRSL